MPNRWVRFFSIVLTAFAVTATCIWAQKDEPHIHVFVDMVQLNVAVTDNKGHYITGLRPQDFIITEDGITEHIAAFGEGNESARALLSVLPPGAKPLPLAPERDSAGRVTAGELSSLVGGANVFVLFDTSNYM